jgi:hypothetical protein
MAKVIIGKLNAPQRRHAAARTVTVKRVRDIEGQVKTLRTLDVVSPTFGEELQYVFRKNVAKARRDNKRAVGAPDFVHKR